MSRPLARRALFLDRDGVINVDHGYVHRAAQVIFCDGIFDLVRSARASGMAVVVVSNQAGIGRGYYTEADFEALCSWMHQRFAEADAPIDRFYHCPFHPQHGVGAYRRDSDWRKPGPGMLLQAAADLLLDLPRSVLVGDNETDIEAGRRAGVKATVLYQSTGGAAQTSAAHCVRDLRDVIPLLTRSPAPTSH
jgi:D-glycero-D-manno-heptose 1,7-bisphosphate phosphatase